MLKVFDASGYLMLSGDGLAIPNLSPVKGFAIATGLHVSFKWGGKRLYVQVAAGFDAIVGFTPFRMAGVMVLRGRLHLFILDISAYAVLNVDVGEDEQGKKLCYIEGYVEGKVSFTFFTIKGKIHFSL